MTISTTHRWSLPKLAAAALAVSLAAAACGSDGDDADPAEEPTTTTTADDTTTTVDDTTTTTTPDASAEPPATGEDTPGEDVEPGKDMEPGEDMEPGKDMEPGEDTPGKDMEPGEDMEPAEAYEPDTEEAQAAMNAWLTVFDPYTAFEDKAAHIQDPSGLEGAHTLYSQTAQTMDGSLQVSDVTVDGTTATITFDLLLAGVVAFPNNSGSLELVDGTWTVTREAFCAFVGRTGASCDMQMPGNGMAIPGDMPDMDADGTTETHNTTADPDDMTAETENDDGM